MSEKGRAAWTPQRRLLQAARLRAINARPGVREKIAATARAALLARCAGRHTMPEHAHPLVRGLYLAMNRERATFNEMARRSGIGVKTLQGWRAAHMPLVDLLDAALNVLDLELIIVPRGRRGPDGFHRKSTAERRPL